MRTFKHLATVLFLLACFNTAYACSCAVAGPPCTYYGSTDAIFLGRAVGSTERKSYVDDKGNKMVLDTGTVRFLVLENFKGVQGYEVEVYSGGPCGSSFLRNESYIVYARRIGEGNTLMTGMCTRTQHILAATEDLEYFRGLTNAKSGGTLYGRLTRIIGDSYHGPFKEGPKMSGVKVVVTGEGETIETTTNDAGEYKLTGLSPGKYDAFPQLPDTLGAVSNRDEQDNFGRFTGRRPVVLADRGCGELSFRVQFSGTVSGRVVDAQGEPAKEVQLNLISGDDADKDWWTWTDKEGRYEFVRVQPGSYLLGFNLKWVPDKEDPYPKTFYPGVKTRSEAALITVGEGEKLKGYDMTRPPVLPQREVKVMVVWPDGRPAVGIDVTYEMNEHATSLSDYLQTDQKGTVILSLFVNHHYILYADTSRYDKEIYAAPIDIFVDKNLKQPLKLVLNKKGNEYDEVKVLKRKPPQ